MPPTDRSPLFSESVARRDDKAVRNIAAPHERNNVATHLSIAPSAGMIDKSA